MIPAQIPLTGSQKLYDAAKAAIGTHLTLNAAVPAELGCMEAWSALAKQAGIQGIPDAGFEGTIAGNAYLTSNPSFVEITKPEPGATIVSVSAGDSHGHIGIFGQFGLQYVNDWGILSNDSDTGTLREQWDYQSWLAYYAQGLKLDTHMYRWVG